MNSLFRAISGETLKLRRTLAFWLLFVAAGSNRRTELSYVFHSSG